MSADLVRSPSGDVLRARDVLRDAQRRPDWALADGLSGRGPLPALAELDRRPPGV